MATSQMQLCTERFSSPLIYNMRFHTEPNKVLALFVPRQAAGLQVAGMATRDPDVTVLYRSCDVDRDGIVSLQDVITFHTEYSPNLLRQKFQEASSALSETLTIQQYQVFLALLDKEAQVARRTSRPLSVPVRQPSLRYGTSFSPPDSVKGTV